MKNVELISNQLPSMNERSIDRVKILESECRKFPQAEIDTGHIIHGGMYARTILIPAGVLLTGALIKIATILILHGNAIAYIGEKSVEFNGYSVLPASANRKQAFLAITNTYLTMIFPTSEKSVENAELEFTNEVDLLISRKNSQNNKIIITGE